jgi:release factor glutamine methyltransferase
MVLDSRELLQLLTDQLKAHTSFQEARTEASWLIREYFDLEMAAVLAGRELNLEDNVLQEWIRGLQAQEPVQYIIGHTWFCGLKIEVNEEVLIPRPETEELVYLISQKHPHAKRVLDCCTGSGCIALALKKWIEDCQITAFDVSHGAIEIARRNAEKLNLDINFLQADLFADWPEGGPFDLIVSNPPYVSQSESSLMEPKVLNYEPHLALFVPDENPLIFYQALFSKGFLALASEGDLYAEINPAYSSELIKLSQKQNWTAAELIVDFLGKERFIHLKKQAP